MKKLILTFVYLLISTTAFAQCIQGDDSYYRNTITKHQWYVPNEVTISTCDSENNCTVREVVKLEPSTASFSQNGQFEVKDPVVPQYDFHGETYHGAWAIAGGEFIVTVDGFTFNSKIQCAGDEQFTFIDQDGDEVTFYKNKPTV